MQVESAPVMQNAVSSQNMLWSGTQVWQVQYGYAKRAAEYRCNGCAAWVQGRV